MKKSRLYSLSVLVIGVLISVSLLPIKLYAESISQSNVNGISVVLSDVSYIETVQFNVSGGTITEHKNYFNYLCEIQLDDYYIGNINITIRYTYTNRNTSGLVSINGSKTQNVKINGNKGYLSFGYEANSTIDPLTYSSLSYTLNSSDVNVMSDLKSLLDRYTIEDESIPFVIHCLQTLELYDVEGVTFDNHPIFKVTNGDVLAEFISRQTSTNDAYRSVYVVGWFSNGSGLAQMNQLFSFSDGSITDLGRINTAKINGTTWQLCRLTISGFGALKNPNQMIYIGTSDLLFIPIYCNVATTTPVSTDFALVYSMDNRLLRYLDQIASGTTQSNNTSNSLSSTTSQFTSDSNDLITIEDTFNNSMNNALQNVSPTFNMGQSFLNSANWVSTQFNRIVNNTPFASLITFGLTLGLGLLIIGKVRK